MKEYMEKNSRGGVKPKMLIQSEEWGINTPNGYKNGLYEFSSKTGELARRVELPEWLDELSKKLGPGVLFKGLSQGEIIPPREEIGESRGHIFIKPPPELHLLGSGIGLDVDIFKKMQALGSKAKWVRFCCYGSYYRLAFSCKISWCEFQEKAVEIQTKKQFMPQMMIGIGSAKILVSR